MENVLGTSSNEIGDASFATFLSVVAIARCCVQYGKYYPHFSYFASFFTSLYTSEIIAKYEKLG